MGPWHHAASALVTVPLVAVAASSACHGTGAPVTMALVTTAVVTGRWWSARYAMLASYPPLQARTMFRSSPPLQVIIITVGVAMLASYLPYM